MAGEGRDPLLARAVVSRDLGVGTGQGRAWDGFLSSGWQQLCSTPGSASWALSECTALSHTHLGPCQVPSVPVAPPPAPPRAPPSRICPSGPHLRTYLPGSFGWQRKGWAVGHRTTPCLAQVPTGINTSPIFCPQAAAAFKCPQDPLPGPGPLGHRVAGWGPQESRGHTVSASRGCVAATHLRAVTAASSLPSGDEDRICVSSQAPVLCPVLGLARRLSLLC